MSEYIKKEDVIQEVIYELDAFDHVPQALIDRIKRDFDTLPTADVVEVVRCKDCKRGEWRVSGLDNKTKGYRCAIHAVLGFDFGDNGYCSYGERKEQEHE